MQNAKIIKILLPSLLLLGSGLWFYSNYVNTDEKAQELLVKKEVLKNAEHVWDLWINGTDSKLFSRSPKACELKANQNGRCDTELLKCLLPKLDLQIKTKNKNKISFFEIEKIDKSSLGKIAPREGAKVVMGFEDVKITLLLEKSCQKIFLPKRNYGYGTKKNPPWDERFDNFERNIFLDAELIPSEGRDLIGMQDFCAKRGMQLLESHLLDAAAFHPVDLRNNRPKYFLRPPLPWTRNFKGEYIYAAQNDPSFEFKIKYCNFIYTKECVKLENSSLPSWMGLKNPLGSLIEVVRNPHDPKKILVPSSTYYTVFSKWHKLGLRAGWSGSSWDSGQFDFSPFKAPDEEEFKNLKLGFRCMQEEFLN